MIARLIQWLRSKVRVVGATAGRRTREQRLRQQLRTILRSDARAEIEFRQLVRENELRRLRAKYARISILTNQAE